MAVHQGKLVLAHAEEGLIFLNNQFKQERVLSKLPSLKLNKVRSIDQQLWVGSKEGAFKVFCQW